MSVSSVVVRSKNNATCRRPLFCSLPIFRRQTVWKEGMGVQAFFRIRWNLSPVKFPRHMAVYTTMDIPVFRLLNKPFWYATILPLFRCNTNTQVMFSRVKKSKPTLAVYSVSRENEGGRVTNTHFSLWQIHTSLGDKYPLRLALTNAPNTFWLTG